MCVKIMSVMEMKSSNKDNSINHTVLESNPVILKYLYLSIINTVESEATEERVVRPSVDQDVQDMTDLTFKGFKTD